MLCSWMNEPTGMNQGIGGLTGHFAFHVVYTLIELYMYGKKA